MVSVMRPVIVDISHYDVMQTDGFGKLARAGYKGVIHKATQGTGLVDITYASRRRDCVDAGLNYGAYHFGDDSDPVAQADHFLSIAQPDDSILLALDWEDNGARTMSVGQARTFLNRVLVKTGRSPAGIYIYGGNLLKEKITAADDMAWFGRFKLWLCQYSAKARVPKAWENYAIWQYTGDAEGPPPHDAPGVSIRPGVDNNVVCDGFDFDRDWGACKPVAIASAPVAKIGFADLVPVSRKASLMSQFKKTWQGLTLTSILSYLGMSKDTYNQVSIVIADHWLAIVVTVAVLCILIAKAFESYMVEDVNAGRSIPSGKAA